MQKFKCCICGDEFEGRGNNPAPVVTDEDAKCCDDCNLASVIPARFSEIMKRSSSGTKQSK